MTLPTRTRGKGGETRPIPPPVRVGLVRCVLVGRADWPLSPEAARGMMNFSCVVVIQRISDPILSSLPGRLRMAREFWNDRRKSSQTNSGYQQLADRPAKADATPIDARDPSGKAARQSVSSLAALRSAPTGDGPPWTM